MNRLIKSPNKLANQLIDIWFVVVILLAISWIFVGPLLEFVRTHYPQYFGYFMIYVWTTIAIVFPLLILSWLEKKKILRTQITAFWRTGSEDIEQRTEDIEQRTGSEDIEPLIQEIDGLTIVNEQKQSIKAVLGSVNRRLSVDPFPQIVNDLYHKYGNDLLPAIPFINQILMKLMPTERKGSPL